VSVIFINGVFDCLHVGHINFLQFCELERKKRDCRLVIALDSDEKVKADKGPSRPLFSMEERTSQLRYITPSIIQCDLFFEFSSNKNLESLICSLKPILIKGERWKGNVVGEQFASEIIYCPDFPNRPSTTDIERRVLNGCK